MTSLVTGASGFLGGRLVQMLAARGEEVTVLARPASDLRHLSGLPVRVVAGDLLDADALRRALAGVNRVYHCAACSTDWAPLPTYVAANVTGVERLVAAALEAPSLERLVHVSTTDVYGYPLLPCSEEVAPVDAGLPYNRTKIAGEAAVLRAHQEQGLPVTVVRPATIYGPRGRDFTQEIATMLRLRLMATVDRGAAPGGFVYVDSVAEAMMAAAASPRAVGQTYNLSDATGVTWRGYVEAFAKVLGTPVPWLDLSRKAAMRVAQAMEGLHRGMGLAARPLLTRHAVELLSRNQEFPAVKARRDFGFVPAVSLEEGLVRSVAWLRDAGAPRRT